MSLTNEFLAVMGSIDEIKEKLTDWEYKQICDGLLRLKNRTVTQQEYRITVLDTRLPLPPRPDPDWRCLLILAMGQVLMEVTQILSGMLGSWKI